MTRTEKYKDLRETLKKAKNKDKYDLNNLVIENILNIDNEILGYRVVDGVTGEIIFKSYNPKLMFFNYHLLQWLESEK